MPWRFIDWKEVLLGFVEGFILSLILSLFVIGGTYLLMGVFLLLY
jgi:hypothetical protein